MTVKPLIDEVINLLGASHMDYIIVPRQLLREVLALKADKDAQEILTRLRGQILPDLGKLDPLSPDLHLAVRAIRKQFKITQTALADAAEMEQPDISDFERDGPDGFVERRERIVSALKKLIQEKQRSMR